MADVFISYKSDRRAAAEHFAEVLADHGYSVWWDYGLVSGRDFGAQIESELRAASAVVVLWCSLSRDSEWVKEEAGLAKKLGTLLPVTIEPVDLPLGFSMAQTVDLSSWDGAPTSSALTRFLRDLGILVRRPAAPNADGLERSERSWRRFGAPRMADFPLVDELERQRPARTLPSAVGQPGLSTPPATSTPPGDAPIATLRPEQAATGNATPKWLLLGGGALACAALGAVAISMMIPGKPDGPAPAPAAPVQPESGSVVASADYGGRTVALNAAGAAANPDPDEWAIQATTREAAAPACAQAGDEWQAIRKSATINGIRAFQMGIPGACPNLYLETSNARSKLVRAQEALTLPPYSSCEAAKKDWAALDKQAHYTDFSRFLKAIPYGLEGCLDMRQEVSKASMAALNKDMQQFNDLRARFD